MEEFIRHGTPIFRRANLAMFAAGVATFGLLYCVQPLMPEFSRYFDVNATTSSLSLSLTAGLLAVAMLFAGVALTTMSPLWIVIAGIVVITFGFFGGHSIVSSWVGRRAISGKAHAASMYLFFYYLGSSVAGTLGGFFYAAKGWLGVAGFVGALWAAGLLIAWRLFYLEPLRGLQPSAPPV